MIKLLLFLFLISCGKEAPPEKEEGTSAEQDAFQAASSHAISFLEDGQIVSRWEDGTIEHKGDSLIWTGVAIGNLPCAKATPIVERLSERILANHGELVRYEPLPGNYLGNEISFDGELGILSGLLRYVSRCVYPDLLRRAVEVRRDYIEALGGKLHKNAPAKLEGEFTYVRDWLYHKLDLGGRPSSDRYRLLSQQMAGWMLGVKASKSACFRANLSWLAVWSLEGIEDQSKLSYESVCAASSGMGISTWDHYCRRKDIKDWIASYKPNQYEFAHQRCHWEAPDGKAGLHTPGLDYIMALRIAYNLGE